MHDSQRRTVSRLIGKYFNPPGVVYDIGSCDVNGTHKTSVIKRGLSYVGADISPGRNVDCVIQSYLWDKLPENGCDFVLSGSCLEHVEAPWLWAVELHRRLKIGGVCIVFLPFWMKEHRYPVDCYRILPDGLRFLFSQWVGLECLECAFTNNQEDTYFVGRKKTGAGAEKEHECFYGFKHSVLQVDPKSGRLIAARRSGRQGLRPR